MYRLDPRLLLGKCIAGRYELRALVGRGGMGSVYKAWQSDLERFVAIKIMDPAYLADQEALMRFEREAKSLSLLQHEYIARFYAFGFMNEQVPYIAMEFLEAVSLEAVMQSRQGEGMESSRALGLIIKVAEAMAFAHQMGVLHRDLKPANILLVQDTKEEYPKIVDFGLSLLCSQDGADINNFRLTKTGLLLGTPDYLSPEQCLGHRADARSDIYALGCIFFQMLSGSNPFKADNYVGLLHKQVNEKPPKLPPSSLPASAEAALYKCLEKDAGNRFQTMSELAMELEAALGSGMSGTSASDAGTGKKRRSEPKGKGVPVSAPLASAGLVFLLFCLSVFFFLFSDWGLAWRCHYSLRQDKGAANLKHWLDESKKRAAGGRGKGETVRDTVADIIASELVGRPCLNAEEARFRLEFAEECFKDGLFADALGINSAVLSYLLEGARKGKLGLSSSAELVSIDLDTNFLRVKRARERQLKAPADSIKKQDKKNRILADSLFVVSYLILDDFAKAQTHNLDMKKEIKSDGELGRDPDVSAAISMLIAAYDLSWPKEGPFEKRAAKYCRCKEQALMLAIEFKALSADKLLDLEKELCRSYIGVADYKQAEAALKQLLLHAGPESSSYLKFRANLACVQDVLGRPQAIQDLKKEMLEEYPEPIALKLIAESQIWAGQYEKAKANLDLALTKIDRSADTAADHEILVLESFELLYLDSGEKKKAEEYRNLAEKLAGYRQF